MRIACPSLRISPSVLKNTTALLDRDEGETETALGHLQKLKTSEELEYLHYEVDEDAGGILCFVAFSFKGTAELARRCGDFSTWDGTHDVTRFAYTLHTFALASSEGSITSALSAFTLRSDAATMSIFLACYCEASGLPLPSVVITDGDHAMAMAMAAAPDSPRNLLCWFYVLSLNAKARVQAVLVGKSSSWLDFQGCMEECRQAPTEDVFNALWTATLDE